MGNFHISLSLASVAGYMYLAGQLPYYTKKRVGKVPYSLFYLGIPKALILLMFFYFSLFT